MSGATKPTAQAPAGVPCVLVVMGVSASGKSTLAERLAEALGWNFLEGDALHPPANRAKMQAGTPLEDADRWPWLAAIGDWMAAQTAAGHRAVVACSALRRRYRDRLRAAAPGVAFVYLHVPAGELAHRLRTRRGHFMPPSLLASQLATLEAPQADEPSLCVPGDGPVEDAVDRVLAWLGRAPPGPCRPG